ncbi:hypothetical protein LOZ51_000292 [Ophidiomyces ophidiicola]|nr:hypothetical protein LOZ55_002681 [Ophidiomyces ophidiicola]KAI1987708.1 hypothetical protein LOZ54_003451 [Ophidiomyces ophidiicola]KAI2003218.1 hypothetical protein LOZ51_000292 [Ophidiomyces ophidiicola]
MTSRALRHASWAPRALRTSIFPRTRPIALLQPHFPTAPLRSFKTQTPVSQTGNNTNTTATPSASIPSTPERPSTTATTTAPAAKNPLSVQNILKSGLNDQPPEVDLDVDAVNNGQVDWTRSYFGLSAEPFSKEISAILLQPLEAEDVEIKPDGIVYLPEIKYRRILNKAFGPGGWGLVPRSESIVTAKAVTREYALVAHGRLISIARGEQAYFNPDGIPTATEGCKSNAMMRCCKDLGVASELWDPRFIRQFKRNYAKEVFVEHAVTKRKTKLWIRKDDEVGYPWKPSR